MSIGHNSDSKSVFLMLVSDGILDFLCVKGNKKLNLVDPFVMATRTWSSSFVISKDLDYTQHYMMLLEQ